MGTKIGIRRETKSPWERRVAITPALTRKLVDAGTSVFVERSPRRIFTDEAYAASGAQLVDDLEGVDVVFGVKEVPTDGLLSDTAYLFFAHVIKGQPYNMGLLQQILDQRVTLIDYEKICEEDGRRLV